MNTMQTTGDLKSTNDYAGYEVVEAALAISGISAVAPTAAATGELILALESLFFAEAFTVKRIGPEAAQAFRALPQFIASGSRYLMLGRAQITINVKLNGQAVLAKIN